MDTVVLYPAIGNGHLGPMAELAKLLTARGLAVSIVVLPPFPPFSSSSSIATFISGISHPSISFHHLPPLPISSPPSPHPNINNLSSFLRAANPHLRDLLSSLTRTSKIRALVLDLFCTHALDVAAEVGLPAYFFFTTAASILAAFLYLPTLHKDIMKQKLRNLEEADHMIINIPGLPPMLFSDMPESMQEPDDGFQTYVDQFTRFPEAKAILVNSFDFLEPRAIKTLSSGVCLPDRVTPPVYCLGPLITRGGGETHECLAWLDEQPKGSVVFLCFGSMGRFPAEQVKEIAVGLERSGQRFLWVVRSPPSPENDSFFWDEPELDVLLPVGFVERTKERGMVVKTWAPQVRVLNHEATGGFVTHCGWNSVMEGLCAGVGLIAWPLYAEQRMNKVVVVEEMKLAVEMKGCDKGMVTAEEVETRVRWLMESEGGKEMRERAKEVKERAATALRDGGSSHAAVVELTGQWLHDVVPGGDVQNH